MRRCFTLSYINSHSVGLILLNHAYEAINIRFQKTFPFERTKDIYRNSSSLEYSFHNGFDPLQMSAGSAPLRTNIHTYKAVDPMNSNGKLRYLRRCAIQVLPIYSLLTTLPLEMTVFAWLLQLDDEFLGIASMKAVTHVSTTWFLSSPLSAIHLSITLCPI